MKADWSAFANLSEVQAIVADPQDAALAEAIEYILQFPPKVQMIREGQLVWADPVAGDAGPARDLLRHVRQVRNNLFHGAKFNAAWFDPERSALLMRHSLVVLDAVVHAVPAVRYCFDG